jgi:hypothetical protein
MTGERRKHKIDKTRSSQSGNHEKKYNGRYDFVFNGEFKGLVDDTGERLSKLQKK